MMIPKKIHQVWAGPDPFPHVFEEYVASWTSTHPDWEYQLWTPEEIDRLPMVNRELYEAGKEKAPNDWLRWRSDIARMEILYRYGGVYADTDSEALKPLDELLEGVGCFFIQSPNDLSLATNAVMGSVPEHPFMKHLLDGLPENVRSFKNGSKLVQTTGGVYITREMRKVKPEGVTVFKADLFTGQSIRERDKGLKPDLSNACVNHKYNNTDRMRNEGAAQAGAWRKVADLIAPLGISYWLTFGTLLGHLQVGRFRKSDRSVHLGIWSADREKVSKLLRDKRLEVIRDRPHLIRTAVNGVNVHFHIHSIDPETSEVIVQAQKGSRMIPFRYPALLFANLRQSVFYHKEVLIPSPPEDYCVLHYGANWRDSA